MPLRSTRTTRNAGRVRLVTALVFAGTLSSACAHYHARPLSPAASLEDFEARRDPGFWVGLRQLVATWDELIDEFNARTGVLEEVS